MGRAHDLEALQQAGIENVDALVHAAAQFVRAHSSVGALVTSPLSAQETQLLRDSGALGLDEKMPDAALQAGPPEIVAQYAQLVAGALSSESVANRLGVVPSRVRQRVVARSLYVIDVSGTRGFPAFQFDPSGASLPGLGKVLAAIDPSVHPITVERFFLTPAPDLESELADRPLSPRDWLLLSLPLDQVVLLAREL